MENVPIIVYCDDEMTSSSKEILFECPSDSKVILISEDMSLDALRKTIIDTIGGDGCVEYECMELKRDDDVGKIFFIFSNFSSKGLIGLNATFSQSPYEVLTLLCKPRKPRSADEIIALIVIHLCSHVCSL
ncbi:hypothetical protein GmHk_14G040507 [Glycine max]|nr:hypothetical protein GmHk_14G040507 [Glycine max]